MRELPTTVLITHLKIERKQKYVIDTTNKIEIERIAEGVFYHILKDLSM